MQKQTIYIIAGIIILLFGWLGYNSFNTNNSATNELENVENSEMTATKTEVTASTTEEVLAGMDVAKIVNVDISGFAFSPSEVRVKVGDTIRWTNSDSADHQIVSDNPAHGLSSRTLKTGETYPFTLLVPGTVTYHCSIHPSMTGTIIAE